jgi:hypothetical protein
MHKECFKCKVTKPLLDFYKHPKMFDGHVNKCKECNKNDVMEHRLKNLEKLRQYDRNRGKNPDRRKANTEITKIWRSEDRRRQKAHNAVSGAIKKGILIREPCCRCNETKSLAHHEDYDRPLDVMWLCQPCHKQRHKEINAL